MFYSKDLLSRRSPLGAIWTIAHGKKLSKNKLMGISVEEICNQILHPEVPHSLRLQGILIGGVVVVFNKQQVYLLEDVQEMMRRVKDAVNVDMVGTSKATLQGGKDKARLEAITLRDEEVLLGSGLDLNNMAVGGSMGGVQHPIHMLSLTQRMHGLNGSLPGGTLPYGSMGQDRGLMFEEDEDAFAAPAISERADSGLNPARTGSEPHRAHARNNRRSSLQLGPAAGGLFGDQDEMFGAEGDMEGGMLFDGMMDPLGGMMGQDDPLGFGGGSPLHHDRNNAASEGGIGRGSRGGSHNGVSDGKGGSKGSSRVRKAGSGTTGEETGLSEEGSGQESEEEGGQRSSPRVPSEAERQQLVQGMLHEFVGMDREVLTEEGEEEQPKGQHADRRGAGKSGAAASKVKAARRKGIKVPMDAPEDIQVHSKEFREWTVDTSPLLAARCLKRKNMVLAITTAAATTYSGPGSLVHAPAGAGAEGLQQQLAWVVRGSALPGVPLCSTLQDLFSIRLAPNKGADPPAGGAAAEAGAEDGPAPKQRRLAAAKGPTGALGAGMVAAGAGSGSRGASAGTGQQQAGEEEEGWAHFDEMHDQVADLPFGGDVEVERLRAASATPGNSDGAALPGLDSAGRRALAQGLLRTGSRATSATDTTSGLDTSGVLDGAAARAGRGLRGSSAGGGADSADLLLGGQGTGSDHMRVGRAGGSSARAGSGSAGGQALMHWGQGALEDLLPAVGEEGWGMGLGDDLFGDMQATSDKDEGGAHSRGGASGSAGPSSSPRMPTGGRRSGRQAGGSEFQLVETDAPFGTLAPPTQARLQGAVGKSTLTVIQIVKQRTAAQRLQGAADPLVSFLGLAQQLTRSEAVKLFVQVLVTQSTGFVEASQAGPYEDILLRTGPAMPLS